MPKHQVIPQDARTRARWWIAGLLATVVAVGLVVFTWVGHSPTSQANNTPVITPVVITKSSAYVPIAPGANQSHTAPLLPPMQVAMPAVPDTPAIRNRKYTIAPGDTLIMIAERYHLSSYRVLYAANRAEIGPDVNLIHPGSVLVIPNKA